MRGWGMDGVAQASVTWQATHLCQASAPVPVRPPCLHMAPCCLWITPTAAHRAFHRQAPPFTQTTPPTNTTGPLPPGQVLAGHRLDRRVLVRLHHRRVCAAQPVPGELPDPQLRARGRRRHTHLLPRLVAAQRPQVVQGAGAQCGCGRQDGLPGRGLSGAGEAGCRGGGVELLVRLV